MVHVEDRASRGSTRPTLPLLHLGRHVLFNVFCRGCDFRGNVQAQSSLLLGERVEKRRDQRGVLAGTRCFALRDLLAAEGIVLLEVRLELRRGRVSRAHLVRKPLGNPFCLLLAGRRFLVWHC